MRYFERLVARVSAQTRLSRVGLVLAVSALVGTAALVATPAEAFADHGITTTSYVYMRGGPSRSYGSYGMVPSGVSPTYQCWTTGQDIGGVNAWFDVSYDNNSGFVPSYYDNSTYAANSDITSKYGIPPCSTSGDGISTTSYVYMRGGPSRSYRSYGMVPSGVSPAHMCWATGQDINGVNVWFDVSYDNNAGFIPSYYDNSTYPTDSAITSKYGIPECGTTSGSSSTGSGGVAVTGQAILNAASQWIGKTSYCWDAGGPSGPTHGAGDYAGEAPECSSQTTTGFDCSGFALYAIYQAGGPNLFSVAHSPSLINYGTRVSLTESTWQVGDIIAFDNGQHFAIYAGSGNVVQANTAVSWAGGGWPDGVSETKVAYIEADMSLTQVLRFST